MRKSIPAEGIWEAEGSEDGMVAKEGLRGSAGFGFYPPFNPYTYLTKGEKLAYGIIPAIVAGWQTSIELLPKLLQ
jgi:hypothetical protein